MHSPDDAESMMEFPRLRVPRVAEELTRHRVLVLEYVEGKKLTDIDARDAELADELWRAYLKQILVDAVKANKNIGSSTCVLAKFDTER